MSGLADTNLKEPQKARGTYSFETTHWSMVLRAGGDGAASGDALEKLCRAYWPPIYSWVRSQGHNVEEAQDLTQEFFARMLRYGSVARANPEQGRFRSFLLGALKNFLANEWHRARAQKRGGGQAVFSLDAVEGVERDAMEPRSDETPDKLFERRWAETLLARVNARLRREYEAAEQTARFDALKVYLLGGGNPAPYVDTAAALGITESAVKSAIHKLRQRYGEMVRHEIAQTVTSEEDVEDEIRCLLAALRS
jgi:RNA polymerase sigma-70 factor (ECF subfamily)